MNKTNKKIGLWEAVSIAVGTMIGASIFSIFGVGASIAGHNLPEAFILSGCFAIVVGYSYAKLGSKIVSNAGPIAFIHKGIGDNLITGALGFLMWLSYVVSISLFAKGFTGYFLPLAHIEVSPISIGLVSTILIAFFTVLNFFGSQAVGKAEFTLVLIKLLILGVFILFGLSMINISNIIPIFDEPHLTGTLNASVVFFLSYMGFGLITNASENIENPKKNVPLAIYISIAIVMFMYISIAVVGIGNLSIPELIKAQDNALAVAAKPFLGHFGFVLISIGALISISSALNATLFGGANIAYSLAKDGELPKFFERKLWFKSTEGLYITAILSLLFALLFNLSEIATITSSIFTMIYIFVLISHYRLADDCGGNKIIIFVNLIILLLVFIALMFYQWQTQRAAFYGAVVTFGGALLSEKIFRYLNTKSKI